MLGSAETTTATPDLFTIIDKQHHIYRRKAAAVRLSLDGNAVHPASESAPSAARSTPLTSLDLQKRVDRVIQNKYSPSAVLVDAELQILQFRGHTSPYLDPTPGEASLNLLRMAHESLVLPLRRLVQAAAERNVSVQEAEVVIENGPIREETTVEVTPIIGAAPGERYYLIAFLPKDMVPASAPINTLSKEPTVVDAQIRRLEYELAETREYLRNLAEEQEASLEELRAANEEARSANEELQSTNEELGTTKEELQSTNEELTTVNEELQNRNSELSATNSDFKNLLAAVSLAILMIDEDLRVRRFNAAAEKLLDLGAHDVGRPIGHIRGRIEMPKLESQVRTVIESLRPIEEELQDIEGRWYSLTIRPYRTVDNHIAGAVATIQDIDPLKRGLEAAEEARDYAEGMIETVREPLVVLDADLRVQRATPAFYETFLVSREETEGRPLYDLGNGQWNHPRLRELLGSALFRQEPFHDYEVEHDFPHIGRRTMRLNARRIPRQDPKHRMLLLAIEDVTERREIAEIRFQRLFETAKDGMVVVDCETETVTDVNPFFLQLTDFGREEIIGRRFAETTAFSEIPEVTSFVAVTKDTEILRRDDVPLRTRHGKEVCVDLTANRYQVGTQPVVQFNMRDITARKEAIARLRETEERFRLFVESVRDYALFQLDCDGIIVSWNSGAERLLGWKEEEVIGNRSDVVFVPEDTEQGAPRQELETARSAGRAEHERWHMRKDGSRFFASGVLTQVRDEKGRLRGFAKIMRDITVSKQYEEDLRRSVDEKSMLVREIHHRVKNNLQVIVSLLSLQANQINNPELLAAFEETEARVRAIAHIHERLYASEDLAEVEFGAYLTQLSKELLSLYATVPNTVALTLNVQDMVLRIEQAIPLGLIANELIINSLKHGLKGKAGKLEVSLAYLPEGIQSELSQTLDKGWGQVRIVDSGSGLPANVDLAGSSSMGFRLVNLLVRQLRGKLEIGRGPGADITVTFPLNDK
jgi:PAS domain S-box-containing protein